LETYFDMKVLCLVRKYKKMLETLFVCVEIRILKALKLSGG